MLTIELDRCNGCGDCVEVCPEGAIQLVGGLAQINSELCTECEVCVQACPTGAIKVARPIAVRREEPVAAVAERVRPGTLATLAGAALSFIGGQLLPRAADAIVGALDRRLSEQPAAESGEALPTTEKQGGRRHRRRGGQE
jgi:NAD-dependent dihydropyrimidine dehydrogenase PreA subunit